MADRIYVIGHVNPDTGTITSAMGYAWLLRERAGSDTLAARAGAVNLQTAWLLKKMVTDVIRGSSRLLLTDEPPQFSDLPYPPQPDGTRLYEGVVSRKKTIFAGRPGTS
jgi:manganese-dependent inorganic pyrophosphatase